MDTKIDSAVVIDPRLRLLKGNQQSYKISKVAIKQKEFTGPIEDDQYKIGLETCAILITVLPHDECLTLDLTNTHKLNEDHYTNFVAMALFNDVTFKSQDNVKFLKN